MFDQRHCLVCHDCFTLTASYFQVVVLEAGEIKAHKVWMFSGSTQTFYMGFLNISL